MNHRSLGTVILVSMIFLANIVEAADWAKKGHTRITFVVATSSEFDLPEDLAKVMALASVAPDYFEFDNPSTHAQTPDPLIVNGSLNPTREDYQKSQKKAFDDSERWNEFYFNASVEAMKQGHRERAAFLLGYSLHNQHDLATHLGITNLVHATWDQLGKGPDDDDKRLAASHRLTALVLHRFKASLPEKTWPLFCGKTVAGVVPEPLFQFGANLGKWDPTEGVINILDTKKHIETTSGIVELIRDFFEIFHANQDKMLELLDVTRMGLLRGENDPKMPDPKHEEEIIKYISQLLEFEKKLPEIYKSLSSNDQRIVSEVSWRRYLAEKLDRLASIRKANLQALHKTLSQRCLDLQQIQKRNIENIARLKVELARFERERSEWGDHSLHSSSAKPPTIDSRPIFTGSPSGHTSKSSGANTERETIKSPVEREPFKPSHSPALDQLKNINRTGKW